jgi:uncharacterized protein (DUF952 family)
LELIYKICNQTEWNLASATGFYTGSAHDIRDGFIHFSTASQLAETAAKHFSGQSDLVLITVQTAALGAALRYEPSRGGALFPHLFGALDLAAVVAVMPLSRAADGTLIVPPDASSDVDSAGTKTGAQ